VPSLYSRITNAAGISHQETENHAQSECDREADGPLQIKQPKNAIQSMRV